MQLVAHIGNIPVEEWVPFLVPIVALYVYGRRRERRRRHAVERLPAAGDALDDRTVSQIEAAWSAGRHSDVSREHLPLLYPPGPDGMTAGELAGRTLRDAATVERLLDQLEELDYLEFEERQGFDGRRVWLTFKGYELLDCTETALLAAMPREAGTR